ncbi:hypothetical protein C0J52_02426 [Blattella germanica]|nr:hypothetical protein C0J52_02426 [Blattella germanica]
MVFLYGFSNENSRSAAREYQRRFPIRRVPDRRVLRRVFAKLHEHGTFTPRRADCGAPRQRRTPEFKEDVLNLVGQDATSTRKIASRLSDFMYTQQPPHL